uniref:Replication protein A subunit n=1 Tax=Cyclopterus lumpus TaxID=8103 RepID=A0A8C2XHF8_CYCLU
MANLSEGAIEALSNGNGGNDAVLQLVNIRKIDSGSGPTRFRVMMSDGLHTLSSFMLSTQLNFMAEENLLAPNCICILKKHVTNILKDKRYAVFLYMLLSYQDFDHPLYSCVDDGDHYYLPNLNGYNAIVCGSRDFGKKPPSAMPSTPGGSSKVVPIASLNPYQSKWTIRARVTNKSSIRTWSNSRGDGKLFSMEIVDESVSIIVVPVYYELDIFYCPCGESTIIPCEDSSDVPVMQCDFVSIGDLENREKDSIIDVIGVCKSVDEVTRLTTKSNKEVSKRTLNLMDMSGKLVTVTLWGEEAEKFDGSAQPILAIKGAKLSDYGGRSLSASFSSTLIINPDIPEAYKLRGWYDKEGHALDGQSVTEVKGSGGGLTNWKTLSDVKTEHLGHGDKADYYTCIATIVYLRKENCLYQACPSQDCNKKVVDQQNGMFRCEKCDKEFPNFKYRLILSANIADYADNQWVTCFQESAEAILGQNAAYLGQLKDSNEAAFDEVFQQANFNTFVFRSRVKLETYNDESRIKATVMDVKPVDHKDYSKRLILNIRKLAA